MAASGKLRIGVIGAGAAGLSTSWLLDKDRYEVTLFESKDRLGGHADTVAVSYTLAGKPITVYVDAGAQFFYDNYHVLFKRLLGILQTPISDWSIDFTIHNVTTKPPMDIMVTEKVVDDVRSIIDQIIVILEHEHGWEAIKKIIELIGRDVETIFYLVKFIGLAQDLLSTQNWGITVEQYLNWLKDSSQGKPILPADFVDNFLVPFLTSIWTVGQNVMECSAYAVLTYVGLGHAGSMFGGGSFSVWAVVDGTQAYVSKLSAAIEAEGKAISYPSPVSGLMRNPDGSWTVQVNEADAGTFDHLIIAAPAWNAVQFMGDVDPQKAAVLQNFDYFHTRVIVHSDETFMPQNTDEWTSVYQYWNGFDDNFQTTWQGVKGVNVFKTWVTYSQRQPDPTKVYQVVDFHHPDHHLAYFQNEISLASLQGINNLWLAGSYSYGVDSHEDAIRSAIRVVTALDALTGGAVSPNLMQLTDWTTQYSPPVQKTQL